jgi:hypothetical protein
MAEKDTVFQQNVAEVASETFDDGLVSINFLTGRYFTMNRCGELVWASLVEASTAASIAENLARGASADPARVLADVVVFLETLKSERMVLVGQPEAALPSRKAPWPAETIAYEAPQLQIFDDLADLILLDPIHDVNEALGWPINRVEPARS